MLTKMTGIVGNLSRLIAKASADNEPLTAALARETLAMAEVLKEVVAANGPKPQPAAK